MNLQVVDDEGKLGTFVIAELELKEDSVLFNRINRDFPEKHDPQNQGPSVGLASLSSADLIIHIDKNREKDNFFESKVDYKRVK